MPAPIEAKTRIQTLKADITADLQSIAEIYANQRTDDRQQRTDI